VKRPPNRKLLLAAIVLLAAAGAAASRSATGFSQQGESVMLIFKLLGQERS
jgi:hypothetical protein